VSKNKYWLIGASILLGALCLLVVLRVTAGNPQTDGSVSFTKDRATIAHNGENILIPAPPGYCFMDAEQDVDRVIIDVMQKMQAAYGNHLWLAFANCKQLEAVRASKNLDAYMDSGMLVTPLPLMTVKMSAELMTSTMPKRLEALNPASVEKFINKAAQTNLSPLAHIEVGQPLIYEDNKDSLLFLMTHKMSHTDDEAKARLTEFDIVTAIKDRPLVTIFMFRNLKNPVPKQEFTRAYLSDLRAANP
jgi:hypothetical protein